MAPPKNAPAPANEKPLEGIWDDTWVKPDVLIWSEMPVKEKNADAFLPAKVVSYDSGTKKAQVEYEEGKTGPNPVRIDKFMERSSKYTYLEDLVDIECLNDAELLFNLYKKFMSKQIFTYCGPTLLITNPYEGVAHFFTKEVLLEYTKCALAESFQLKDKPPHVWAISALTYWQLFANARKQAICISGESGAGKTVNAKLAMQFLTFMSSAGEEEGAASSKEERIEDKILGCNPILEAFGNSRTVRNDNSSRFGKYVALICKIGKGKSDSKIIGAATTNYLLEKSRIVQQAKTERNYHIFYQCMYGLPEATLKKYNFENKPEKYDILRKSECYKVPTVDDIGEFKGVTDSFVKMEFSEEEIDIVYSIVGAVLNLGNLEFDDSEFDGSKFVKIDDKRNSLSPACVNLGLDKESISKALTRVLFTVMGKTTEKAIDKIACNTLRDSLAKDLFEKLFNWLVKRLNVTILPAEDRLAGGTASNKKDRYTIGLLDIFGFEIFQENSIEQFCINFTNENLHQLYIEYVFKAEEITFKNEGLGHAIGKELSFEDNQHIIDLLSKGKECVIALLNETTRTAGPEPKKNDAKFFTNVKNFCSKNANFKVPRLKADNFTIVHTAREVDYCVNNFISKNQDSLSPMILECIYGSSKKQLVRVFKNVLSDDEVVEESTSDEDKNKKFLAYKFNQQMYDLMAELKSCECNFLRCIKPNEEKKKEVWDQALTIGQIRYLGILDSIKIRKSSYPYRRDFKQFYRRYIDLDPVGSRTPFKKHEENPNTDWKALCMAVHKAAIPEFGDSQILFGNTKVFARIEANIKIEKVYLEKLKKKKESVLTVAEYLKFYKRKQMFFKVTMDTIKLTKILRDLVIGWKSKITYRRFRFLRNVIRRIQRVFRLKKYLRGLRRVRMASRIIKSTLDAQTQIALKFRKLAAAQKINKVYRGAIARKIKREMLIFKTMTLGIVEVAWKIIEFRMKTRAATKIQSAFRGWIARRENYQAVSQIKSFREDYLRNQAAMTIQAYVKMKISRARYLKILDSTKFIQGFFFMKTYSRMLRQLRNSSIRVQIAIRKFLSRKHIINKRMNGYMETEGSILQDVQQLEASCMTDFASGIHLNEKGRSVENEEHPGFALSCIPEVKHLQNQKISLWMFVLDINFLSDLTDVYDPIWAEQYKTLFSESLNMGSELQLVEVGSTHTVVASNSSKLYSWGLNDYGQLARKIPMNNEPSTVSVISQPKSGQLSTRVKNFACGEEHTMFVDKDGDLYVAGRNDKGQLGIHGFSEVDQFVPQKTLNKVDVFLSVVSKGQHSVAIGSSGSAYYFPFKISHLEALCDPVRLVFPEEVKVTMASCGFDFVMLLSSKGLLFSMGKNHEGQLGHGNKVDQPTPQVIQYLWQEKHKIKSVSCGLRHSVCRAASGKMFTWGWGGCGQLGFGNLSSYSSPKVVRLPTDAFGWRVLQVRASARSCLAIGEDSKLYWWGTNGTLKNELYPVQISVVSFLVLIFTGFESRKKKFKGKTLLPLRS